MNGSFSFSFLFFLFFLLLFLRLEMSKELLPARNPNVRSKAEPTLLRKVGKNGNKKQETKWAEKLREE